MYNGIGLQTPRGSGTNGYIQSNKFFVKPKTNKVVTDSSKGFESGQGTAGVTRKPNQEILEHDRKRQIELKLLVLEEKLIDQGYTYAEIAEKLDEVRKSLEAKDNEDGENNGVVVSDKVSETQTHQVAALKERQMETLKAALGIESEADREKKLLDAEALNFEDNLDELEPGDIHEKDASDGHKQHGKDARNEKDDIRKVGKKNDSGRDKSKRHSTEKMKRRYDDFSDSDGSLKHGSKQKHKKYSSGADSSDDSDTDVKKRSKESGSKHKKKKAARHDSSSDSESLSESDCDSSSDSEYDKKYDRARGRRHTGSGGSPKSREQTLKKPSKSKRFDSDDDSSDEGHVHKNKQLKNRQADSSDEYNSDDKHKYRRKEKQAQRSSDFHSDNDFSSDEGPKDKTRRAKEPSKSWRHDSDDEFYADRLQKDERSRLKSQQQTHRPDDSPRDDGGKIRSERKDKAVGRYQQEIESDSDETTKKKRKRRDKDEYELSAGLGRQEGNHRKHQTHDSGKVDNRKNDGSIERNKDDQDRDRAEGVKSMGKNRSGHGDGSGARGGEKGYSRELDDREKQSKKADGLDTFKKLEQLYKLKGDGSGDKSEGMTRDKRKIDDVNQDEQRDGKSRRRDSTKETGYEGTKVALERESKSRKHMEDNVNGGDRGDTRGRNEVRHADKRENREREDGRSRRDRGDEEGRHGRKHEVDGDEEESYKRGRPHERERRQDKEGEHAGIEDERDREFTSKRSRYDEERSSVRRYYDDRNEDRRSRHRR